MKNLRHKHTTRNTIAAATSTLAIAALTVLGLAAPANATPTTNTDGINSVWAWGNSVSPNDDNRGLGETAMSPTAITSFAESENLQVVYLNVPWASNQGAIETWLYDTVTDLHAAGIKAYALGGDPGWLSNTSLAATWATDALDSAPFDGIEYDVEANTSDYTTFANEYVDMLTATREVTGTLPIGGDLPWWFTGEEYGTTSTDVFATISSDLDSVAIVTYENEAAGTYGIDSLSSTAASEASSEGKDFTIGITTDTPEVAGGSDFTFYGDTETEMETQTALVNTNYANTAGYQGITVEHLLAWENLIAAS